MAHSKLYSIGGSPCGLLGTPSPLMFSCKPMRENTLINGAPILIKDRILQRRVPFTLNVFRFLMIYLKMAIKIECEYKIIDDLNV